MSKIKVIVLDLGGVLFTEGKKVGLKNLAEKYGYDEKVIFPLISARLSEMSNDARKGLVSEEAYWQWVQKNLPLGYRADLIKEEWWNGHILDQEFFAILKKIKELNLIKLMIFSGNFKSRVEYLENKYHFEYLFDEKVYSFDEHLNKSGNCEEFLAVLIKKSGVKPEEILYFDNDEDFILEACKLGINGRVCLAGEVDKFVGFLKEFRINF